MKLKHFFVATIMATLALGASAQSTKEVRIYINPGHGSFTGSDRPMSTIKHGNQTSTNVSSDTSSFFESNTNLQKGFGMLGKLIEYGVPFDPTKNQNNSNAARRGAALDMSQNIVMSHVKCGGVVDGEYNRALSEIRAEVEANNFDMFISIHSNASTGDHNVPTHINQLLFLYRGTDGNEYVSGSSNMAKKCWVHATSNKHMNYNWLSNPNQPRNTESYSDNRYGYYPSGTDANGYPYWIKGDITFTPGWDSYDKNEHSGISYRGSYGVMKHGVPGFLVEGYDHTYQPAMHRAMNDDVCHHEGQLYAKGINDYFGWGKTDSYGKIYGVVRDHSVVMDNPYYQVTRSNTVDANTTINQTDNKKPLNYVIVKLYDSAGKEVDSYTTDDEWNGVYMFKNVAPGSYTIKHSLEGYNDVTQSVTVTANQTNYLNIDMRASTMGQAVQGHYAYGLSLTKKDEETYTASFKSTGDMNNGKIILTNSSTGEKTTIETGSISKGSNSVTIDASKLEADVNYTWAVAFDNPQSSAYKRLHKDNTITYTGTYKARLGVAIDNDETSANFGTIYTITGYGQGMRKYNPDFSTDGKKFMTSYFGISDISNSVRLETNGGKVYIANNDDSSAGVWVYDPSSSSHSKVISTKAAGVAFYGTGSSRKMYISGTNYAYGYNIGSADSWSGNASTTLSSIGTLLPNGDGDIYATDNAIIASQIRYSPNNAAGAPAFIVTDRSGNITFNSPSLNTEANDGSSLEGCNGGGFAFSKDKSIFAIVEGATNITSIKVPVKIYAVRWNGSTPTFVYQYTISLDETFAVDQMAFDHADNLYIASRQEGLLVYAIKTPARQTVTNGSGTIVGAKTPLYIVGNSDAIGAWDPYKAVEFSNDGKNYTITLDENVEKFKISTNKGESSGNWTAFDAGNLTSNEAITNGGTIKLLAQHGGDFVLPWAGVWTITVARDFSTLTATTSTPKPLPPLYIVGNSDAISNWEPNNAIEISNDGEKYNITLNETATEFKISTNKGDWTTFNAGNLTPNAAITNGGTVNLSVNKDAGNIVLPWAGVWNITIAGDLSTLTASTSTPKPLDPLYIVGNSDAIGAWDPYKAVEIANDGKNYNITLDENVTEFKISTNKGESSGNWTAFDAGNLTTNETITNGGTVNLKAEWGYNFVLPWEGVWNITVSGDLSTLTASTSTPDPNVGPEIGPEPEDAPNPDAIPGESEEDEDDQPEGYFAYDLQSSLSGNVYTFKFKSTGARKNGRIVLTNKSTGAKTEIKTPVEKGQNSVTINAYDIQKGDYTWAVELTNNKNEKETQVGSDESVVYNDGTRYARIGVAIDNDQTSKNFGAIYTMTAFGQGLQKFNPDVTTNGSKILTGMFGQDKSGSTSSYRYVRSNRLETHQGKVYIANYAGLNPGVWEYDPTGSATATKVSGSEYYDRAITFYGEGSNRKAFGTHATEHHVKRFDIGTNTSWVSNSPTKYFTDNSVLQNGDGDILVTNNAVIVSQNRYAGNNASTNPAFAVFDHDLNLKYKSNVINGTLNGSSNGGMAISTDYKTFAIIDGYNETTPGDLSVQVYSVSWNGSTPTFTHQYSFALSGTRQVDQMEFDHGGNLLIASREKGLLKWAVRTSDRATVTNARSEFTIKGLGRETAPSNVVATRKCYSEGNNNATGTVDAEITWKGDAGDYKVFYQTMRRDAEGYREYDNNGTWVEAGTATIASGSTTGKFTHKNLAAGSDYNRIYNYKVANYYPEASYASTCKYMEISGKGRTVTSAVQTVPVNAVLSQPGTVVDGVTQYSLDLKLDLSLNQEVFTTALRDDNDEMVTATKYVIVVDEATAKALNAASNVKETGRFYRGPATMTANNCNHHVINDWYMVVDFDDVTPADDLSKATKSITWKDIDLSMTYQPQVYTSAVRTFNFTSAALSKQIVFPTPQWKSTNVESGNNGELKHVAKVIPATGNQIAAVVGTEDQPIGAFRKVGDNENATNPVEITKANVIGATGMIEPIPATDEIMNEWDIAYTFMVKDADGNIISTLPQESKNNGNGDMYSNTEQRQVDVLGLQVGHDASTAPDGRARYVYNAAKNKAYKLVVRTTYSRQVDGVTEEYSNENETDIVVNPSFPSPEIDPYNSPGYLFLETSTHWDENCKDDQGNYINGGYYKYYYDAAMDIAWKDFEDDLTRYMGYYAKPQIECVGHPDATSNEWTPYLAASIMTDGQVEAYNDRMSRSGIETLLSGIGYTGSEDWSVKATENNHIPVKVHYVWAGNEKLENKLDATFDWELSANYPVIVYDSPLVKVNSGYSYGDYDISAPQTRGVAGYDMQVITAVNQNYQQLDMDNIVELPTTGVDALGDGNGALRLYPNPADGIVTLQAPVTITGVKIFSIDGQLVKEFEADDTKVRLNVSDLPSGVYIVNAGGSTTRLIKK